MAKKKTDGKMMPTIKRHITIILYWIPMSRHFSGGDGSQVPAHGKMQHQGVIYPH